MSLILEALRKSEAERRRGQAPDLLQAELAAPRAPRKALSPWYWAGALLALLPLVLWLQRDLVPAASTNATVEPVPAPAPAPMRAQPVTSPAAPTPLPPVAHLQPAPPAATPTPTPAPSRPTPPPPPPTPKSTSVTIRLAALPAAQRKALPPLHLTMHLWNEEPARRFAILDGQRVVEGDRVGDAVVAEISPHGVVLDLHGERILVGLP